MYRILKNIRDYTQDFEDYASGDEKKQSKVLNHWAMVKEKTGKTFQTYFDYISVAKANSWSALEIWWKPASFKWHEKAGYTRNAWPGN